MNNQSKTIDNLLRENERLRKFARSVYMASPRKLFHSCFADIGIGSACNDCVRCAAKEILDHKLGDQR